MADGTRRLLAWLAILAIAVVALAPTAPDASASDSSDLNAASTLDPPPAAGDTAAVVAGVQVQTARVAPVVDAPLAVAASALLAADRLSLAPKTSPPRG